MFLVGVVRRHLGDRATFEGLVGLARLTALSPSPSALSSRLRAGTSRVGLAAALGGGGGAPIASGNRFWRGDFPGLASLSG